MKEEILGGLIGLQIVSTVRSLLLLPIKAMTTALICLSNSFARLVLLMLENYLKKVTHPNRLLELNVDVYDLIDVEKTNRFMAINGVILHNCLGIQFGMAEYGLQRKLTLDTGVPHTLEESTDLITMFEESYPEYGEYKEETWEEYREKGYLKLRDGWTMFGDNINKRSVLNMPIQGHGAAIMRKAVIHAQAIGLQVTMTLHDALYIECNMSTVVQDLEKLAWCMTEAFKHYFIGTPVEKYAVCRLDPAVWGDGFNGETLKTSLGDVVATNKYIDKKRFEDYKRYRKYFVPKEELDLLLSM